MSMQYVDLSGRSLGPRALKKRRQLMDVTAVLLANNSLRDLRVVDIAREIGTSPATFYQYFKDVDQIVLELAEEATEQMPELTKMFSGQWQDEEGLQKARDVVDAFIQYWDKHGAVLRVRNLAADQGDERFLSLRSKATTPLLAAMIELMNQYFETSDTIKPMAAAVAMGAILDRLSSYHKELEGLGVNRKDLVETSAHILFRTLTNSGV